MDASPVNRKIKVPSKKEPVTEQEKVDAACGKARHGRLNELKPMVMMKEVSIDCCDHRGNTLLILGCQNNHKKIVKFLVKNGADIHLTNKKGHNASHYATLYQFDELLPYLGVVD